MLPLGTYLGTYIMELSWLRSASLLPFFCFFSRSTSPSSPRNSCPVLPPSSRAPTYTSTDHRGQSERGGLLRLQRRSGFSLTEISWVSRPRRNRRMTADGSQHLAATPDARLEIHASIIIHIYIYRIACPQPRYITHLSLHGNLVQCRLVNPSPRGVGISHYYPILAQPTAPDTPPPLVGSFFFTSKQMHIATMIVMSTFGATVTLYVCCPPRISRAFHRSRRMAATTCPVVASVICAFLSFQSPISISSSCWPDADMSVPMNLEPVTRFRHVLAR
ncbi:hypothetical protein GGS23DRAFT_420854 [Durotheca rogersii]|uniref:uncharacterized protein n=1 Tax=Durotheca rogersii TaxID=419775 RepID=UPI00221EBBDB|nr:uncharacterized protein GGS23DRAFT_420854 [Durotheca rogersii]KAI5865303.1 hypothetical protein GGS23DRAFT_420854 [Durotheca rogersii]